MTTRSRTVWRKSGISSFQRSALSLLQKSMIKRNLFAFGLSGLSSSIRTYPRPHIRTPVLGCGTGVILSFTRKLKTLAPWNRHCRRATRHLSLIEHRICSHVCWPGGQHLLLAVNQIAGVESGEFEAVSVSDRIRGTRLDAVSAEDTSVVVDVINLGVAFRPTHSMLGRILRRLDVNAVRGTRRRAQETGYAFFQSVLVTLQNVHAAKTLLEHGAPKRPRTIRIVLPLGGLEHL